MKKSAIAVFMLMFLATIAFSQEHQLVKKWETDTLLKVPESVLYDAENKILYVTNIDGQPWEKDNKGSVGKVGLDGKIIAVDWVSGFNAPKGMGLYKNNLYVADVDKVGVIDTKKGVLTQTIPVTGAEGLNDLTVDKKGVIYVSDSKTKKVHRIENGQVTTWLENLKGPNGVFIEGNDLYLLDAGSLNKVEKDKSLTKLADGLEHVTGKDYIVSCWIGTVYYVKGDGTKQMLLDTREQKSNTADIGYDAKNRIVYIPTFFKNKIVAYELK
ncbi:MULTISPECIES: SMP-30/gluconolactonase/LRE family protein [Niastella]|uniref:SMP-30/gluconolactonase/LRE family protein n=1 Tax=Niastella soli TaxID=2821487 RepID=A0ABS3Z5C8_9BACT|nr:SMP-30/gluconolactonase/LRE family protein [Niastella soli]MBO9205352.1 SMP-30/gluconolactonase/LRE family protein [Niastella soli]